MADIGKSLKTAWLKSMEAIGNTASNIANSTRSKLDEMNVVNRRRDILSDFGARAYELWQKGEKFPAELEALLEELSSLDEQLNTIRTERLANVETKAEKTGETVADAVNQVVDEVTQTVDAAADTVSQVADEVAQAVDTAAENLSDEDIVKEVAEALEDAAEDVTKPDGQA